ncbi:MAG: HPr kinase/phosphatase C-terminal domain-containing protein [Alphaproteobacteria bacterium]|nr:HPr kinase/phosphatase C-terminal domain-containing protein [Alphaproteobacteria bacterium]
MAVDLPVRIHATTVALNGMAALIRGPSGAGKSDLALRCLAASPNGLIESPLKLVSDDYTEVFERAGRLWTRPPETIANLLEIRGLGPVRIEALAEARLGLVVDLVDADQIARFPDPPRNAEIAGRSLPSIVLCATQASATAKLMVALEHVQRCGQLPFSNSPD